MKLDSLAAEVGFDMNVDAILARVEQLVKLEGDAVIENKTMAYSLRRKVGKKRHTLTVCFKDKHYYGCISIAACWRQQIGASYMDKEFQRCSLRKKKMVNVCKLCKQTAY